MAQTVNLKISKVLSEMIEELAKKNRKNVEDYLSEVIKEKYKKL
jgi:predicted HicB family RNase H-like nuclease